MNIKKLTHSLALLGLSTHLVAMAQTPPVTQKLDRVEITGSSIKRIASEGALPIQVITSEDLQRLGIVNAEQLIMSLNVNGNGLDNLASNADVVAGAARGGNGLSAANLRGQGSDSTLVLLNGRRVASHGLNGRAVDLSSIPMAAIERVEILKDGASAIYGTDAIGGVINFILRKNYKGLEVQAFTDVTQQAGGNIDRVNLMGGFGNLETDKYNVLVSLARSQNQALSGDARSFVNTFQPNRGLSVDTRGTPYATLFAIGSLNSALSRNNLNAAGRSTGPTLPGSTLAYNGINVLNLPGGAGCNTIDGQAPYDAVLWALPLAKFGCAWDTGRAAAIQQPVESTNVVARGTLQLGEHQVYAEFTGSKVDSSKKFSAIQMTSSTLATSPLFNLAYPSTGVAYNSVFNQLVNAFPQLEVNRGLPLAMRWRCLDCGSREIDTTSETSRVLLGADGPFMGKWDYRTGLSTASSTTSSRLGNGYFYGRELAALINTGVLNPFLLPGQSQTAAALAGLQSASANGVTLFGGKFTLVQADATLSGPVFKLPAGDVMAAVGVDLRQEKYRFDGNATDLATQARIFLAPFDSINTLNGVSRDIKAVYTEVLLPVTKQLELTGALRRDDYSGFGVTTNPKVSLRFTPTETFLVRGAYSTGFRVPTFAQLFFGVTESPYSGKDLVDPAKCATGKVDTTKPGCESVTPTILTGGKSDLGPEKSKQWTTGFVWAPSKNFSMGADLWNINKTGTIQSLSLTQLVANHGLFADNFRRDVNGNLVALDQRWVNAGETVTTGIDINVQANGKVLNGQWNVLLDGSYLLNKKSKLISSTPFGDSEVGTFTRAGDLGLRWKHALTGIYTEGPWIASLTQLYRSGYVDGMLPGVANGSIIPVDWNSRVATYTLHHVSVGYTGIKNTTLTFGIKNLFNQDPPFSAAYDSNTGAGSSWEPRVADPRGRSFTFQMGYKF